MGLDEAARKSLAWLSLSYLALATVGEEKGKPELSLISFGGAGLNGRILA